MSLVLTLTPNPAIDISTSVEQVQPVRKLRCRPGSRDPGGGGLNVARVASRLGATAVAIYPAGGFTGQELAELVRREAVESVVVPISGDTREDFTVLSETDHEEYRFVLPGPRLKNAEWMACLKALSAFERNPAFICASGSLPPGAPDDFYARAAEIAEMRGAKFALDTSGPALEAALRERIHVIKPNLVELAGLVGAELDDEPSRVAACRTLIAGGRLEMVALTLGADGALLVTADAAWRARPLAVPLVSSVGAGDSFLGAMVWALGEGLDPETAFRYGAAAGAAALLAHGTELSRAADVRRLLPEVVVEPIGGGASS
ncbi:MAG: 1-phosphofructokinase family hexose kinase [Pseudomonadota bacterium]|jgi:6-phosphofructokinase 2